LEGGTTVHSLFKAPIACDSETTCNINVNSELADLIRNTELIVWDEAVMAHKDLFSTVNKTLKDIMRDDNYFGNKLMLLGGDFRQILPVVHNGNRASISKSITQTHAFLENC